METNESLQDNTESEVSVGEKFFDHEDSQHVDGSGAVDEKQEVQQDDKQESKAEGSEEAEKKAESESEVDSESKESSEKDVSGKYELKLKEDSLLTEEHLEDVMKFAKDAGLDKESAQKVLDREEALLNEYQEAQAERMSAQVDKWKDDVFKDEELGGSEEKFKETLEMARRVAERFGSDKFMQDLNSTGLGNHPELIRVFSRLGRAMANDKTVSGARESTKSKSAAEVLYPNQS